MTVLKSNDVDWDKIHVEGIRLAVVEAGIYARTRPDLCLIECAEGSEVAAMFTQNAFCAAPVTVAKAHVASSNIRYLLVNAGNANAGTGERGLADARQSCALVAASAGVQPNQVLPFSTGVIGEYLPMEKMARAIALAYDSLETGGWRQAARAIMTTDTVPKVVFQTRQFRAGTVALAAIAKGSGMIHPQMATMLAYVFTDAKLSRAQLQACLNPAVQYSFNAITVDGDTSTNDAVAMVATQKGVKLEDDELQAFSHWLNDVCLDLAKQLVRDGEGAGKFVEIRVCQGADETECRQVAFTIAHSPLVKTALFASDPNWGRILAAVGRAGLPALDLGAVTIVVNDVTIVARGERAEAYTEEQGRHAMAKEDIVIEIRLGRGDADATVWTCDLSHDYIKINAEYRT